MIERGRLIVMLLLLAASVPALAQNRPAIKSTADTSPRFRFDFPDNVDDFGPVYHDSAVESSAFRTEERTVTFKNIGTSPLIIREIKTSCGCLLAEFTGKNPVLPGKKGHIRILYSIGNRYGPFDKTVFIQSNAVPNVAGGSVYEFRVKGVNVQRTETVEPPNRD